MRSVLLSSPWGKRMFWNLADLMDQFCWFYLFIFFVCFILFFYLVHTHNTVICNSVATWVTTLDSYLRVFTTRPTSAPLAEGMERPWCFTHRPTKHAQNETSCVSCPTVVYKAKCCLAKPHFNVIFYRKCVGPVNVTTKYCSLYCCLKSNSSHPINSKPYDSLCVPLYFFSDCIEFKVVQFQSYSSQQCEENITQSDVNR